MCTHACIHAYTEHSVLGRFLRQNRREHSCGQDVSSVGGGGSVPSVVTGIVYCFLV